MTRWRAELLERWLGADGRRSRSAAAVIEQAIREQDAKQERAASLSREREGLEGKREELRAQFQTAEAQAARARAEAAVHEEALQKHDTEAKAARESLAALVARHGWEGIRAALERGETRSPPSPADSRRSASRRPPPTRRSAPPARTSPG